MITLFLKKIFQYHSAIIIVFITILAFIFRIYYLNQNNIVFGYDQARDAYIASQISQGDLKILGPPVSLGGFYHGVLYYYFISLPYYLSQGNPIIPIIFLSILNVAAIPLIYIIGKRFFTKEVGFLSAIFYSISFDVIQYSNWLSNPSLAVPFSVVFFYGLTLYLFTKRKNIGSFLIAIGYGLCFQSQFFLGYLLIPIIFSLFYFKIKPTKRHFIIFTVTFLLTISTMILSYFKFGFTFINGLQNMFSGKNYFDIESYNFIDTAKLIIIRLVENFSRVVFPLNSFYAFIFVLFCFYFLVRKHQQKTKFIKYLDLFWIFIFSQIIILPFGGVSTAHINVGLQIPAIMISAVTILNFNKTKKLFTGIVIFIFCLFSISIGFKANPQGSLLFAIQKPLTIKNEIDVINYTYTDSNKEPFSINTVTSPYWINTLWSYVYQQYGQNQYHYLPSFHGRDQTGQLSYLPQDINPETKSFYLIIEPNNGIPQYLIDDSIAYEDSFSQVVETKNFNGIIVQKRELIKPLSQIVFVK